MTIATEKLQNLPKMPLITLFFSHPVDRKSMKYHNIYNLHILILTFGGVIFTLILMARV